MDIYSKTSDKDRWKHSYQMLYIVAALNIFGSILSFFIKSELLTKLGGKYLIITGIIFIILSLLVHKRKSTIAVWFATIYWSIEIISTVLSAIYLNNDILFGGIFMKIFILYYIAGGIGAVKRIRNAEPLVPTATQK